MKTLSVEQAAALLAFAARSGRSWKAELRTIWATCGYDRAGVGPDEAALLQQVRNAFGPSWLDRVTMKQLRGEKVRRNKCRRCGRSTANAVFIAGSFECVPCFDKVAAAAGIVLPAGVTVKGDASTEPGAGGFEITPPIAKLEHVRAAEHDYRGADCDGSCGWAGHTDKTDTKLFEKVTSDEVSQ